MDICLFGNTGRDRVDNDKLFLFDIGHHMGIGHSEVAPPDHHDICFGDLLRGELAVVSSACQYPCLACAVTETTIGTRTTQFGYQQVGHTLHDTQMPRSSPLK